MASPNTVKEKLRFATLSTASFLGVFTLSSCGMDELKSPADRYRHDYTNGWDGCLDDTPYDDAKVLISQNEIGQITVMPAAGNLPPLRFDGYEDKKQPLHPADSHTVTVTKDYGCKTESVR